MDTKLYIKKRSIYEWLTIYIFLLPFFFGFFIDLLHLPNAIKYTIDIAWVTIFAVLFLRKKVMLKKNIRPFVIFTGIFFIYTFIVYLFNFQSPLYYLWGLRNNFRFYIAFFAFATFLDEYDVDFCFKFIDIAFWIDIAVSLVQYFFFGYNQDSLGGIFGVQKGCNSYQLLLFCFVIAKSLIWYINKKEKLWLCALKSAAVLIISAMAEMKAFFFLFAVIVILVMLVTSFSWRKLVLSILGFVLLIVALIVFSKIFPEWVGKFTMDALYEMASSDKGYTSSGDLNRLNAIPRLWTEIFDTWYQRAFGLGLGNCDTSAFSALNTNFFMQYEHLHYTWFHDAFLFLETGIIGVITVAGFYGLVYVNAIILKRKNMTVPIYSQFAMVMAIISVFMLIYNSSLRSETGYMIYFALALPFIGLNASTSQKQT